MVMEKQEKREQMGPGQDQPSGQTSTTDPAGTVPLLWAGVVPSGNQTEQYVNL